MNLVFQQLLAATVATICLVLLARLMLAPPRRRAFDQFWRQLGARLSHRARSLLRGRKLQRRAEAEAQAAIRRASDGQWKGNVYTPKSFRRPRKPH